MKKLYIIDPTEEFTGSCLNTMLVEEGKPSRVSYTSSPSNPEIEMTFEEYKKDKENPNLTAVTIDELYKLSETYWKTFCSKWEVVSEKDYDFALNCLPPLDWGDITPEINIFYMSEFYTGFVTRCYAKVTTNDGPIYIRSYQNHNKAISGKDALIKEIIDYASTLSQV